MSKQKIKLKKKNQVIDLDIASPEYRNYFKNNMLGRVSNDPSMAWEYVMPEMEIKDSDVYGRTYDKSLTKTENRKRDKAKKKIKGWKEADINQPGGLQRGAEVMKFPLKAANAAVNLVSETLNTPLALAGEYISGREDYGTAFPNINRVTNNAGLTGFVDEANVNQQVTPGEAIFPDNPLAGMLLDIPADMLISRGANTVFNPIFKQGLKQGTKTIARELTKNRMTDIPGTVSQSGFAPNFSGTADEVTKEGNLVIKKRFNRNKTIPESIDVEGKSGSWQLKKNNAGENLWYFSANMDNPVESGKAAMKMNELFPLPNPSILEPNSLSLDSYPLLLKMGNRPNWSMSFEDYIPLNYSHKHSDLIKDLGLSSKDETYRLMSQETADEIANRVNNMLLEKGIEQKARTFQIGDYRGIELPNFKLTRDYQNGGKITNMKKKKSNNLPKYFNGTPGVGTPGTQGSLFNILSGLQQLSNQNPTLGNQNPNFQQMPNQNLSNMNVTGKGMSNALQGATGSLAGTMKMLNGPLAPLAGMAMSSVTDMIHAINTPERERRPVLQNASSYTFDNGGTIKIKPSKKGTFTAAAKKHGKSVQAFASQVLANTDNYSPAMVKKANFARNAAKWKKAMGGIVEPEIFANGGLTGTYMDAFDAMAYGGMIDPSMYMQQLMYGSYAQGGQVPQNIPVEVEGEEMYEMPNGQTGEFSGPKHENGGMPMSLPEGTKIYSDRLKVNGKTMAARKDKREANIAKLEKLLSKNPNDKFVKEALKRQQETNALQEQGDMQQQEMANQQQAQEEMAMEEMLMGAAQQDMQEGMMMAMGGMIKRADNSYSQRGLWDNIRANAGSGKKPTKEMLAQEKKIKRAEKAYGGMIKYADGGTLNKYAYGGEPCEPGFVKDASGNCVPAPREVSGVDINRAFRKGGTGQIEPPGVNPYDAMNSVLGNTFGSLAISKDPYFNTKGGMMPNLLYNEVIGNKMLREEEPKKPNRFMNFLNNAVDETGDFFTGLFDKNGKPKKERGTNTNPNVNYDLTEGDRTGMFGTSVGMYGPAMMTMLNRMETPPNTNYFSTFGQDALRTQEEAEGLAGISKDEAYRKNLMRANALRKQLANTARGVNDIRSGQLTAELAEQEGARGILTNYLQGMSQLKGQRAGLQQQIDQTRMGGEQQRDLADRQDIDQYYTNLAENVANASNMMQKQGRDLNVVQYNKDIMNLSKAYSKYGIYAVRDPRSGLLTLAHKGADGKITYLSEEEAEELAEKQQPTVITTTVEEPKKDKN